MSDSIEIYPWLKDAWQKLDRYLASGRIPHALMIHGAVGLGKGNMAEMYAQKLLCRNPNTFACGKCASCRLLQAGSHPDFKVLEPEESGKAIKIDSVRKLIADLELKSHFEGYRVVLFKHAEMMNLNSANALLKTLEEPVERTVMILVTEKAHQLPATILSRCQKLLIQSPRHSIASAWLKSRLPDADVRMLLSAADNSPLRALELNASDLIKQRQFSFDRFMSVMQGQDDPIGVAETWNSEDFDQKISWIQSWVLDLMRLNAAPETDQIKNPDVAKTLRLLAYKISPEALSSFWSALLETRKSLSGQANRQLVLEEMLIKASRLVGQSQ